MAIITYAYKVINSTPELKVMEVEYTAEGYPTVLVGLPLPTDLTNVESIIAAYSPVHHWLESTVAVVDVPVGTSGVVTYDSTPAQPVVATTTPAAVANQQMWDQVAFEQKVAAALVKFGVLATDPTQIPVTTL
jgi:hypothetical protein